MLLAPPALVFHLLSYLGVARFHINLRCSESESGDIALHFNPRFDGWDKVVFNAFKDGSWESEEKIRRMPFTEGHAFETLIGIGAEGYEVRRLTLQQVYGRSTPLLTFNMSCSRLKSTGKSFTLSNTVYLCSRSVLYR